MQMEHAGNALLYIRVSQFIDIYRSNFNHFVCFTPSFCQNSILLRTEREEEHIRYVLPYRPKPKFSSGQKGLWKHKRAGAEF